MHAQFDEATDFLDGLVLVRTGFWRVYLPGGDDQLSNTFRAFRMSSNMIGSFRSNQIPVSPHY